MSISASSLQIYIYIGIQGVFSPRIPIVSVCFKSACRGQQIVAQIPMLSLHSECSLKPTLKDFIDIGEIFMAFLLSKNKSLVGC